jgi:hypothetical protein
VIDRHHFLESAPEGYLFVTIHRQQIQIPFDEDKLFSSTTRSDRLLLPNEDRAMSKSWLICLHGQNCLK